MPFFRLYVASILRKTLRSYGALLRTYAVSLFLEECLDTESDRKVFRLRQREKLTAGQESEQYCSVTHSNETFMALHLPLFKCIKKPYEYFLCVTELK